MTAQRSKDSVATSVFHNNTVCSEVKKKIAALVVESSDYSLQKPASCSFSLQTFHLHSFVLLKPNSRSKHEVLAQYIRFKFGY